MGNSVQGKLLLMPSRQIIKEEQGRRMHWLGTFLGGL